MSAKTQDIIKTLTDAISQTENKVAGYDTTATVRRVEDGTAWVHIPGGVDETPVKLTTNAKVGDSVQVRVSDGRAFLVGNATNPPTDDTTANAAQETADAAIDSARMAQTAATSAQASAETASTAAATALEYAETAKEVTDEIEDYADTVSKTVTQILTDGETAGTVAQQTQEYLKSVVTGATTVEKSVAVMQAAIEAVTDYDPTTTTTSFTGDGTTTAFSLDNGVNVTAVTIDGTATTDYTTSIDTAGKTVVTFTTAPSNDAVIVVTHETLSEYFWHDSNGAHVLGGTSGYRNDITSTGMAIKQVSTEDTVASFGADGAQIGIEDNSHLNMDYHSMQLIDKEGNTYFWVSDLRDADGYLTEYFTGDGSTTEFTVANSVGDGTITVTIDGTATTAYSRSGKVFTFATAPSSGAEIAIKCLSTTMYTKCYTLGTRASTDADQLGLYSVEMGYNNTASGQDSTAMGHGTTASGENSTALGQHTTASGSTDTAMGAGAVASGGASTAMGSNTTASGLVSTAMGGVTTASGDFSHAQNYYTIAAKQAQTALGTYNVEDTSSSTTHPSGTTGYGQYAVIVGNGTSSARSNALTVDWNGGVEANGDSVINADLTADSLTSEISYDSTTSTYSGGLNDEALLTASTITKIKTLLGIS